MYALLTFTQRESPPWTIAQTKQVMVAIVENPATDGNSEFYITVELQTEAGPQWKKIKGWELNKEKPNLFIMPPGRYRIEAKYNQGESDISKNRLEWFISPTDI